MLSEIARRRGKQRDLRAVGASHMQPCTLLGDEEIAVLDLLMAPATTSPIVGAGPGGTAAMLTQAHLEPGRGRTRAVDWVDDQDEEQMN